MRHQRPCGMPPPTEPPERAALALWATPVHASSIAESTTDDHLTLPSTLTQMFVVGADPEHAACTLPSTSRLLKIALSGWC